MILNMKIEHSNVLQYNYSRKYAHFYVYIFNNEGEALQNLITKNFILDAVNLPVGITKDFIIRVKKIRKNFIKGIYQISLKPSNSHWKEGEYIFALKVENENKDNAFNFLMFEIPSRLI